MYYPGQIVYDLEKKTPVNIGADVWDKNAYPERSTHFVIATGRYTQIDGIRGSLYEIFLPRTLGQAKDLLEKNIITPAPLNYHTHCWKCENWYNNCRHFKKCSESDHPAPFRVEK